ncbi:hypothetical protein DBR42_12925, partial [Pelomonas sp. HMWF004]
MPKPPKSRLDNPLLFNLPDGTAVSAEEMIKRLRGTKARAAAQEGLRTDLPEADLQTLTDALLLLGCPASITAVLQWLEMTGQERANGQRFTQAEVREGLQALVAQGRAQTETGRGTAVDLEQHTDRLQALLAAPAARRYWRQRLWLIGPGRGDWQDPIGWLNFRSQDDMRAALRLMIFSGMPAAEYRQLLQGPLAALSAPQLAILTLMDPWLPGALQQIDAELRDGLLGQLLDALPLSHPLRPELLAWLRAQRSGLSIPLRARLAEAAWLALDFEEAQRQLHGLVGPGITLLAAAQALAAGRWAEASDAFETAIKGIHTATRSRRDALSLDTARFYLLSLLAQDDPKAWARARKYAVAESGSRSPGAYDAWGVWALGIGSRLGDDSWLEDAYRPDAPGDAAPEDRLLICAWLGRPAPGWTAASAQALLTRQGAGQALLAQYLGAALKRLDLGGAEPTQAINPFG